MTIRDADLQPFWQAIDTNGNVVAGWHERGAYTPGQIRRFRDKYHPGTRLQVTRYARTVTWDDEDDNE